MKRKPKIKRLARLRADGTKSRLRRCIGCYEMKEKTLLLRAVRIDGVIYFDSEHKANGRGAYICKNKECFKKAYKGRQFERSLKAKTSEGFYGVLEQAVCEE